MASISEAMDQIIYVGIGIFVLVLILSLTYQGYAQSANQITQSGFTGAASNFSKYAGPLPNTYASNLGLAITALVLFVVIAIIAGLFLNQKGGGVLGQ